ncbi:hypothetical protein SDC9_131772 [bioreactor metagenome]|uniref:Glycosyltransferase RgtA/B/C/D-like domain-containing protein n=1 Tax=bioreactor metagenome TaxID=1076179 RepID=A0A645D667_9ZZZZ
MILSIFSITIFNILLIIQINSKYSIIRAKSFLPVFFFALFISVWKETHFLYLSHLALSVFLICLMLFLGMYRNRKAVEPAFIGSFLMSLTGLINPVYLFLIPVSWIGFMILKCFSIKVFFASVIGLIVPWIYYFSYNLYTGNEMHLFENLFFEFKPYFIFSGRALHEQIYIIVIISLLITGLAGIYTNLLNDSIQTRKNINLILVYLVFLILLVISFAKHALSLLPFIAFCLAMLLSHPFTLNKSKLYPLLFIIFCLVNIAYMFFNYYTL